MKKIFTLLALLPAAAVFGQAITINATDMPVPSTTNCEDLSASPMATPSMGASQVWNYGTYSGVAFVNSFTPETITAFTSLGVDVNVAGRKTLTTGFFYYVNTELDFNSTSVMDRGVSVPAQGYDLAAFTASTADSLIFPAQNAIASTPRTVFQFPFTANSSWESSSRRAVNFEISVASAMLDHTPGQHVFYSYRKDTIVGWGKMTVHAASGPSIQYDVLMDKIIQYNTDSFYLGGAPAPPTLMAAFSIAQDQKNDSNLRYNFYRKGHYNYLYSYYYGSDATFSTPQGQYVHKDGLTGVGVDDLKNSFTTVVFPNPATGNDINILVSGKNDIKGSYIVTDMAGRTVQVGEVALVNGTLHIALDNSLVNGNYIINVINTDNTPVFTEQFSVAK